jgi:mono/diheme cytochrome c family protein
VIFLGCTGLFAWYVGRQPTASPPASAASSSARGAALFQTYCASCHTAENLRSTITGPPGRLEGVERFLVEHGDAPDDDDRLILDYLSEKTR